MSWDLVMWRGAPADDPPDVWEQLTETEEAEGLARLSLDEIEAAFEEEFGDRVVVTREGKELTLVGQGWDGLLERGDIFLHLACESGVGDAPARYEPLVRAGLRAGCTVFDPQSEGWWEVPDDSLDSFDVEDDMIHKR